MTQPAARQATLSRRFHAMNPTASDTPPATIARYGPESAGQTDACSGAIR